MTDYKEYKKLKDIFGDEKTTDTIIELFEKSTDELTSTVLKKLHEEFNSEIKILKSNIDDLKELLRDLTSEHDRLVGRVADYIAYKPKLKRKSEEKIQESSD